MPYQKLEVQTAILPVVNYPRAEARGLSSPGEPDRASGLIDDSRLIRWFWGSRTRFRKVIAN
jgi:hypothetical protein